MPVPPDKNYFSARRGRGPAAAPFPFPKVRRLVVSVLEDFRQRKYFQEAFGYHCVDAGDVPGTVGSDPGAFFLQALHYEIPWPYWADHELFLEKQWEHWNEDTMCDVVEVLHDLVSKPKAGRYHDFSGCGWHYSTFDRTAGQQEFRDAMNHVLRLGETPYEIDANGLIVELAPDEFRTLLEADVPPGTDHDSITRKIDDAVTRFRARGASIADKHAAVRDLADVLELLREDVKTVMLRKDESDLFNIANNFAIRHHNRKQRQDYDSPTWLPWMFYVYLATIHAVLRVRDRPSPAAN